MVIMTEKLQTLIKYFRRDLEYLEGIADGIQNEAMQNRIHGMKRNLKEFEESAVTKDE